MNKEIAAMLKDIQFASQATMLDFFAAHALTGVLANDIGYSHDVLAQKAFKIAQAMVKEKERIEQL